MKEKRSRRNKGVRIKEEQWINEEEKRKKGEDAIKEEKEKN